MKIFIAEDVFIEADHLSRVLTKAGHTVTAIAKSVDQAFTALKKQRPDIAMLDIFLQGNLTGVHLAQRLTKENIPFIYLSANVNPSILDAAKETNPFGFLVKPFRESDILMAVEIAVYRHRQTMDHFVRQQQFVESIMSGIINTVGTWDQKILLVVKGLQRFIPFDHVIVDLGKSGPGMGSFYCFRRVGLEEYARVGVTALMHKQGQRSSGDQVLIRNGQEFHYCCLRDPMIENMRKNHRAQSSLTLSLPADSGESHHLIFFSASSNGFTIEHAELISQIRGLIKTTICAIRRDDVLPDQALKTSRAPAVYETWMQNIVGKSGPLLQVLDLVRQVASSQSTVLIQGETGVGKEGIATAVHRCSERRNKPFIKVNCAAISPMLIESELFGHEKGAFTDAVERRIGKFEQASGGTIFLDEIGELPLSAQAKILRVLQEREIERVGGFMPVKLDVRIIAATNRNLYEEVSMGRFRMDLYYRINVFPIEIPPLRERKEDIALLAEHFLHRLSIASGKPAKSLSALALGQLMQYAWPGNIRELQHLLERHVLTSKTDFIDRIVLPAGAFSDPNVRVETAEVQPSDADVILAALRQCNGRVSGKGGAAELIGINPNTFSTRMRKLGIRRKFIF